MHGERAEARQVNNDIGIHSKNGRANITATAVAAIKRMRTFRCEEKNAGASEGGGGQF